MQTFFRQASSAAMMHLENAREYIAAGKLSEYSKKDGKYSIKGIGDIIAQSDPMLVALYLTDLAINYDNSMLKKFRILPGDETAEPDNKKSNYRSQAMLIVGETGTGKELIAKALHYNSLRAEQPFIPLNCAALPEQLIEAELFGYDRGAFTGAKIGGNAGVFERARYGTVYLDEIGDMPLGLQTRLLRVLQEREVERIGTSTTKPIPVHANIVASTNVDLWAAMKEKKFRDDLYHRLAQGIVYLPNLRERNNGSNEIIHLVQHFIKKSGMEFKFDGKRLETWAKQNLPGNVRDLENVIQRAIRTKPTNDNTLTIRDLEMSAAYLPQLDISEVALESLKLDDAVSVLERRMIDHALQAHGGKINPAAEHLGISRHKLRNKIKALKITDVESDKK